MAFVELYTFLTHGRNGEAAVIGNKHGVFIFFCDRGDKYGWNNSEHYYLSKPYTEMYDSKEVRKFVKLHTLGNFELNKTTPSPAGEKYMKNLLNGLSYIGDFTYSNELVKKFISLIIKFLLYDDYNSVPEELRKINDLYKKLKELG